MKWKRMLTAGVLTGALLTGTAEALTVKVDGRDLTAGSYLEGGTTYVPLRVLARSLGEVAVWWDGAVAWVEGRGLTLSARPGDTWIVANGQQIEAPGGVHLVGGVTLVPVRALAAAMGAEVAWDGTRQAVELTSRRQIEENEAAPEYIPPADTGVGLPGQGAGPQPEGAIPETPEEPQPEGAIPESPAEPQPEGGIPENPAEPQPGGTWEGSYTAEDLYWLSRIISAESQGEPLEGKLAVGTVVMNRVASPEFPDTIYGVIFDSKWGIQFTPVANGAIYWEPTRESEEAARMVLEGARAAGNSLYFQDPTQTTDRWAANNRKYVTTIGSHWFYE